MRSACVANEGIRTTHESNEPCPNRSAGTRLGSAMRSAAKMSGMIVRLWVRFVAGNKEQ